MNKALHSLFTLLQVGIIVFAVIISLVRLGVPHIDGYESHIDAWFKKQGVQASFSRISLRLDRFTPKILINGLNIIDADGDELLTLNRATLAINIWQSLLAQKLIIEQADLLLSKAVLNTAFLKQPANDLDAPMLSPQLMQSLLAFNRFTLKIEQLDIVDQAQRYALYDSVFTVTGQGDIKYLSITSGLLQRKETQLKGQLSIDFSRFLERKLVFGDAYVSLSVASLSSANIPGGYAAKGQLNIKNWISFKGADWSVKSHLNAQNVSLVVANNTHNLEVDSLIEIRVENGVISSSLTNKSLSLNNIDLKDMTLVGQADENDDENYPSSWLVENIAIAKLQKTLGLIPQLKSIKTTLEKLKPRGELTSLFVRIPNVKLLEQSTMRLRIKDAQWKAFGGIPSVNKMTVDIVASLQKFNAYVRSSGLEMHLADFYSKTFKIDRLTASINGQMNAASVLLEVPDINIHRNEATVRGRLSLNIQKGESPFMFLRLQANNASMQTVRPFLPQILMDKDVLDWVKQSVKKARVNSADVLYFGRLENDVNFDAKNNGIFETALNVVDIDLNYDAEWPSLRSQEIDLTFKNYQLLALSQLANAHGLKATELKFTIADLNVPQARLSLKVNAAIEKQWGFLKKSPIKSDIPYFSDVDKIKGYAKTQLNASFPLANNTDFSVKFKVNIKTHMAGFDIDKFGVSLSDLNANLKVTQDEITMKPATAEWFKQPINLEIANISGATQIKMKGNKIDVDSLLNNLPNNTKKYFSGKSSWEVNALINPPSSENKPVLSIAAHSGLTGTAIHLPPPFSLSNEETRYLKVYIDVYRSDNLKVYVSLDKIFDARLSLLKNKSKAYDILGGRVNFGKALDIDGIPFGLHISGSIDDFNVDHWEAYLLTDENMGDESSTQKYLALIENIDLTIKKLHIKSIAAEQVKLTLSKIDNGLQGAVQSSVANGRFFVPLQQAKNIPIDIDFDNVDITLIEGLGKTLDSHYKTDDIPNVVFKSKLFSMNGSHFTNVQAEIESNTRNQFKLKNLSLQHKDLKLKASGEWFFNEVLNENESYLRVNIKGKNFGQSISELGIGDAIENGEIDFNGSLEWPNTFWSLDFATAKGKAKFKLSDGYLLDVEPGEGRFIGLLSLSALPRRLTLDFSDFFKEGLQFDYIKGDFLIHDGSMWTTNLKMSGSVSEVSIVGRTGLKEKDYDQVITIIPQVRDALPVIGSLVAGSSVGWAMLLFQRLFKDPIDDSVSIKYKVTGNWDAPKIDLIEKPALIETEEPEF